MISWLYNRLVRFKQWRKAAPELNNYTDEQLQTAFKRMKGEMDQ